MRSYTENVWDEIEPVTERALDIGLEKVIDQLADDRAPKPERVRQARTRRRRAELDETASIAPLRFAAERVIAGNELTHIHYLLRPEKPLVDGRMGWQWWSASGWER